MNLIKTFYCHILLDVYDIFGMVIELVQKTNEIKERQWE